MAIFDNISEIGSLEDTRLLWAWRMKVSENMAYLTCSKGTTFNRLVAVDISDLGNPLVAGEIGFGDSRFVNIKEMVITKRDNKTFVTVCSPNAGNIITVDATDPSNMTIASVLLFPTPVTISEAGPANHLVALSANEDSTKKVYLINIKDPYDLIPTKSSIDLDPRCNVVSSFGNVIWAGGGGTGAALEGSTGGRYKTDLPFITTVNIGDPFLHTIIPTSHASSNQTVNFWVVGQYLTFKTELGFKQGTPQYLLFDPNYLLAINRGQADMSGNYIFWTNKWNRQDRAFGIRDTRYATNANYPAVTDSIYNTNYPYGGSALSVKGTSHLLICDGGYTTSSIEISAYRFSVFSLQ